MIGEKKIPARWKDPIHDDFRPGLKGMPEKVKISALSTEIAAFAKQVVAKNIKQTGLTK